ESLGEADVSEQIVWRERLLEVEQLGAVERAEGRLVLRPFVAAVGIDRKWHPGAGKDLAGRPNGDRVPSGRHFDLHSPVALGNGGLDPALQGRWRAILRDPEGYPAGDGGRVRLPESLAE